MSCELLLPLINIIDIAGWNAEWMQLPGGLMYRFAKGLRMTCIHSAASSSSMRTPDSLRPSSTGRTIIPSPSLAALISFGETEWQSFNGSDTQRGTGTFTVRLACDCYVFGVRPTAHFMRSKLAGCCQFLPMLLLNL